MSKQQILDDEFIKETKVRCEICGKEFEQITNTHLKMHGTTMLEYREQFPDAFLISESCRKKHSDSKKVSWKDPEYREAHSGEKHGMFGRHQPEEVKQKITEALLGTHLSEATKQKISEANLGSHRTEEQKQHLRDSSPRISGEDHPMHGTHRTEAIKQKISEGNSGEKHWNWQDGISSEPYCIKFNNEFKERVREFFGRCCYLCGKNETENGCKVSVHHVNYDKMVCCNGVKPLFVPLCMSCHTKTLKNRKYWEEFFSISLKYRTKDQCFLPKEQNTPKI